jgi:IMP dehydrogenase
MPIEQQAREVAQVKKFESGIVRNPITVSPDMTIREVIELTHAMGISGVPVVDGKTTVGIVTGRDLRFETRMDEPVSAVMTPQDRLVTVAEGASDDEVKSLLHRHRIEKVLVVDSDFALKGMITAKDFQKAKDYPQACKDDGGALRASKRWSRRVSMSSSSTRRTASRRASSTGSARSRQPTRICR